MSERESVVEAAFRRACAGRGWVCWKLAVPGVAGVPDRMVLMPGGRIAFVELKRPGGHPRCLQLAVMLRLIGLGFRARVWDGRRVGAPAPTGDGAPVCDWSDPMPLEAFLDVLSADTPAEPLRE